MSGNYQLPTDRRALLYVRQSNIKQVRDNIYSGLQQTEDMIDRAIALGWGREQCTIFIENNMTRDGKIRGVSGTIPIEDRPGISTVIEHIKRGAGAILGVDVSRLTRDVDLVDAANLAQTCKRYNAVIVTSEHVYDFRRDGELDQFMSEAKEAANYIKNQVGSREYPNGKLYRGRSKKAERGKLVVPVAPVGLMVDESRENLKPSPHAERVNWLFGRFRALGANLAGLQREIVAMTNRGEPLFPDNDEIDPKGMFLQRIEEGWTIGSLLGLRRILTNPAYQGHLVYAGRIIRRNAFPAIVDADDWHYAERHLSDVDLDGNPIQRENKSVQYEQRGYTNRALLAGVRDNGRLVIDSVNGAHVYANAALGTYIIRKLDAFSVTGFIAAVSIKELDRQVEERLLHWCRLSERAREYQNCEQVPHLAMGAVEQQVQPISTVEEDTLAQARQELARVQRALATSQDVMDDTTLKEHFASKARLVARIAKLEQAQKDADRRKRQQEQAKRDIGQANDKWATWSLEERHAFVRLVTDSIILEELANGWLRLTVVWSPLMGFLSLPTSNTRVVDTLYLWRPSGSTWSEDEKAILREYYSTATVDSLLHMLPTRSWLALKGKANKSGIYREAPIVPSSIPENVSLSDLRVVKEFAIQPGKRVQWQHQFIEIQITNGDT